jgi:hypothetical protein
MYWKEINQNSSLHLPIFLILPAIKKKKKKKKKRGLGFFVKPKSQIIILEISFTSNKILVCISYK